jgi:hypothetical protein
MTWFTSGRPAFACNLLAEDTVMMIAIAMKAVFQSIYQFHLQFTFQTSYIEHDLPGSSSGSGKNDEGGAFQSSRQQHDKPQVNR